MRSAIYARVSTYDKEQDPETQLRALRAHCHVHSLDIDGEYVDRASARDLSHRTEWRRLIDDAAARRFQVVLVHRLDRAFRSVKHMHDTLAMWDLAGVTFTSAREGFDTSTPVGRLMLNVLASFAEFELEVIRERVLAGMDRARAQGQRIGRPPLLETDPDLARRFEELLPDLLSGKVSARSASCVLAVSDRTVRRLLAQARSKNSRFEGGSQKNDLPDSP